MNVPVTVLSEKRWCKDGEERAHYTIREWLLGTIKQGGMDRCWADWCKVKHALYSMETSPRHDQERSRKQRGPWINKFCELIVNASPKAPVNKTFTWGLFCTTAVFPTLLCSLCICAKHLSPTQLLCIANFFYASTLDHTEKTMLKALQQLQKQNHKLPKSLSPQFPAESSFSSFSKSESILVYISCWIHNSWQMLLCSTFTDVCHSVICHWCLSQDISHPQHHPRWAQMSILPQG